MPTPAELFDTITSTFPKDLGQDNIVAARVIRISGGGDQSPQACLAVAEDCNSPYFATCPDGLAQVYDPDTGEYIRSEEVIYITGVIDVLTKDDLLQELVVPTDLKFMTKEKIGPKDFIEIGSTRYKIITVVFTPMYECVIRLV